jgi:3,4-dihydroxy 2-butanone 4-phosphate synthase/GTP cyclohydrolase II
VLVRAGQTEASIDLARLAGLYPAGVICEIMDEDGSMMRAPRLAEFSKKHGLKMITVKDLIAYRLRHEKLVERIAEFTLPTIHADFRGVAYETKTDKTAHVALVLGEIGDGKNVLVRVHSECLTGAALAALRLRAAARCRAGRDRARGPRRVSLSASGRPRNRAGQ